MRTRYILIFTLALLMLISPTLAQNEDEGKVDLADFPQQLADKLGIDLFSAQLLASSIFLALFTFPGVLLAGKDNAVIALLIIGLPTLGFCIAMGWLGSWFLLIVVLVVSLMFGGKMRDWISGVGR